MRLCSTASDVVQGGDEDDADVFIVYLERFHLQGSIW